ncbi:hypothetical protein OG909_24660 [Streptomyces sp. NBC_01754]|uniref:hypothetical protein n=1 Tax=Streptomyces sp. NBC_01754 TaxID=2975930 RepID=UPI002DD9AD08|nr:hypothetical protein [Streptomyces sp. NBC_01754]WSC95207.1 hypothetical protein OG909_24660 [Streptomyces sp. NBC_01754]
MTIPTAQMYQEVRDLARTVDRIESKIDGILDETKDIRADVADHETRIRSLEATVWRAAGGAAALGAGSGVLAQYLLR